jgi:two-component system nitrate/nitrite response regulator NarL
MKLFETNCVTTHVFYSETMQVPVELQKSFPSIRAVSNLDFAASEKSIVWFHLNSIQTIAQQLAPVKQRAQQSLIVVMSDIPNDLEALASFSMLAKAYCNTHAGAEMLLNIASVVEQGGIWIGESIMQKLLGSTVLEAPQIERAMSKWSKVLTGREFEVAKAIAIGLTNKEIALKMHITERTVKAHVGAVLDKLQLKNRLQLALLVKEG